MEDYGKKICNKCIWPAHRHSIYAMEKFFLIAGMCISKKIPASSWQTIRMLRYKLVVVVVCRKKVTQNGANFWDYIRSELNNSFKWQCQVKAQYIDTHTHTHTQMVEYFGCNWHLIDTWSAIWSWSLESSTFPSIAWPSIWVLLGCVYVFAYVCGRANKGCNLTVDFPEFDLLSCVCVFFASFLRDDQMIGH